MSGPTVLQKEIQMKTYEEGYRDGYKDGYLDGISPPQPYVPENNKVTCRLCGMTFSGISGYYCIRSECPIQPKVS